VWLVTFKKEGIVQNYCNQTIKVGADECIIENALYKRGQEPIRNSKAIQVYHTKVVFRISGMPPNANGLELLKELNLCGFKLTSVSDLAHVLCTEVSIKDLRIKSGIIEVRQPCPKAEQGKYQSLAFGKKKMTFGGKLYDVKFSRPGICFKCNSHGHKAVNCPKGEELRATWLEQQFCNFCHLKGHLVRLCPKIEKKRQREAGLARFIQVAPPSIMEQKEGDDTSEGSDAKATLVVKQTQSGTEQVASQTPHKQFFVIQKLLSASSPKVCPAPVNESAQSALKRSAREAEFSPPAAINVRHKAQELSPIELADISSESETSDNSLDNSEDTTVMEHSAVNATNDSQVELIQYSQQRSRSNSLDQLNNQNAPNE